MKRWIVTLAALALLLLPTTAWAAHLPDDVIAGSDAYLWNWHDGDLTCTAVATERAEVVVKVPQIRLLAAHGDEAYCLLDTADACLITVDVSGDTSEQMLQLPGQILKMDADAEHFYFLVQDGPGTASLYRQARVAAAQAEKIAVDGWKNEHIADFDVYDGILLAYEPYIDDDGEIVLAAIDTATDEVCSVVRSLSNALAVQVGFRREGAVYAYAYCGESLDCQLRLINMSTGTDWIVARTDVMGMENPYALGETGLPRTLQQMTRTADALYLCARTNERFSYPIQLPPEDYYDDKLVIVEGYSQLDPTFERAVQLFHQRYPEIEVCVRDGLDSYDAGVALESGEPGYDVLVRQGMGWKPGQVLAQDGIVMNLAESPEITALLPEYLDMFDSFYTGDALYAVPIQFYATTWKMNGTLLEQMGLDLPEYDWTWDEFFALADRVREYNELNGENVLLLEGGSGGSNEMIDQININAIDWDAHAANFQTEEYEALLSRWTQLEQEGLIAEGGEGTGTRLIKVMRDQGYSELTGGHLVLTPRFEGENRYEIDARYVSVNASSRHAEAAAHFVACLMQPESVKAQPMEARGQMLLDTKGYAEDGFDYGQPDERGRQMWRALLADCAVAQPAKSLYREQMFTMLPQLRAGEMTAAEFLAESQRLAEAAIAAYMQAGGE